MLVLYGANLFAAYEVCIYRRQPAGHGVRAGGHSIFWRVESDYLRSDANTNPAAGKPRAGGAG
jgi:hypothetical protein